MYNYGILEISENGKFIIITLNNLRDISAHIPILGQNIANFSVVELLEADRAEPEIPITGERSLRFYFEVQPGRFPVALCLNMAA